MWASWNYCEVHHDAFRPDECDRIVDLHKALSPSSGHLDGARECSLFWVYPDPLTDWVFDRIHTLGDRWNDRYGFDLSFYRIGLQLCRYRVGERYDWHMDLGDGPMSLRKLSLVVELSRRDDHDGRLEVFYGERDNRTHLSQGSVAIFPSFVMHRAVAPTRGERWTLAAWLNGASPFR